VTSEAIAARPARSETDLAAIANVDASLSTVEMTCNRVSLSQVSMVTGRPSAAAREA
jgi:hypothetical protein